MSDEQVIEVCHGLINRAMRCEQESASAKYAAEYREQETAIRAHRAAEKESE